MLTSRTTFLAIAAISMITGPALAQGESSSATTNAESRSYLLEGAFDPETNHERDCRTTKDIKMTMEFVRGRGVDVDTGSYQIERTIDRVLESEGDRKTLCERQYIEKWYRSNNGIQRSRRRSSLEGCTVMIHGTGEAWNDLEIEVTEGEADEKDINYIVLDDYERALLPGRECHIGDTWVSEKNDLQLIWGPNYREMTHGEGTGKFIGIIEFGDQPHAVIEAECIVEGIEEEYGMNVTIKTKATVLFNIETQYIAYADVDSEIETDGKILAIPASGAGTVTLKLRPEGEHETPLAKILGGVERLDPFCESRKSVFLADALVVCP
ncbi:MAG: hypothetical protein NUW37_02445 [Planctomycetes bacterium]|nr:hypothetical protein [Planctomycetota bacterium]